MDEFTITILGVEYIKSALDLFNTVFGLSATMEFWMHKHYENPLGDSIFVGAFYEGKLVAINGFQPINYRDGLRVYKGLQSCESAVDIHYRKRGLFSRLISYAEEWAGQHQYDFLIGHPNIYSYPGFIKLGWESIGCSRNYGRIENMGAWLEYKKTHNKRPLADALLIANYIFGRRFIRKKWEISITMLNITQFLDSYKTKDGVIRADYTKAFLEWKLEKNGKIYEISDKQGKIAIVIVSDEKIVFWEQFTQNTVRLRRGLQCFYKQEFAKSGIIDFRVDYSTNQMEWIRNAGFITKREPENQVILKRLSENLKEVRENIVWETQIIEGA